MLVTNIKIKSIDETIEKISLYKKDDTLKIFIKYINHAVILKNQS